jgi:hypothetical protein
MVSRNGARRFPVRTPGIISRALDDEFVVIHPVTHEAHSLSGLVARVWAATDGAPMPDASDVDIEDALGVLYALDLVQPTGLSRRSLLRRGSIVAVGAGVATIALPEALAAASPTFSYHSPGAGRFVVNVPAGIKVIKYVIIGAGGGGGRTLGPPIGPTAAGGAGGNGGALTGSFTVAANPSGFQLIVCAGAAGQAAGVSTSSPIAAKGGTNAAANVTSARLFTGSGGNGIACESGGGGGASYIAGVSGLVVVAPGGGGGGDSFYLGSTPPERMSGGAGGNGGANGADGVMGPNASNKTPPRGGAAGVGSTPGAGGLGSTYGVGGVHSDPGNPGKSTATGVGGSATLKLNLYTSVIGPGGGGGGYAGGGTGGYGAHGLSTISGFVDSAAGGGGGSSRVAQPTGVTLNTLTSSSVGVNAGVADGNGGIGSIMLTGTTH